jgi:opacity protein-like surface antigen
MLVYVLILVRVNNFYIGVNMNKYTLGIIGGLLTMNISPTEAKEYYIKADIGVSKSEKIKSDQGFYKNSGKKSFNSSPIYSLGFGYEINDKLRSEVTYSYTNLKYKRNTPYEANPTIIPEYKQKVNIQTGMVNLFYDIVTYQKLTPYIGFGLGYAKINPKKASILSKDNEGSYQSNKSENLTYALMGGVSIAITDRINFDIGYKFQDFGKANGFNKYKDIAGNERILPSPIGYKIKSHSGIIGVRYNF